MTTKNVLVELFVEELPPKALRALGEAFAEAVSDGLVGQRLKQAARDWTAYASPRRLAVHVPKVAEHAADRAESVKLMPVVGRTGRRWPGDAGVVEEARCARRRCDGRRHS